MLGGRVFTQNFRRGGSLFVLYCPLARIANFLLIAKNIATQIRQSNLSLNELLVSLFAEYFWVSGVPLRVVYLYKWESVENGDRLAGSYLVPSIALLTRWRQAVAKTLRN